MDILLKQSTVYVVLLLTKIESSQISDTCLLDPLNRHFSLGTGKFKIKVLNIPFSLKAKLGDLFIIMSYKYVYNVELYLSFYLCRECSPT